MHITVKSPRLPWNTRLPGAPHFDLAGWYYSLMDICYVAQYLALIEIERRRTNVKFPTQRLHQRKSSSDAAMISA